MIFNIIMLIIFTVCFILDIVFTHYYRKVWKKIADDNINNIQKLTDQNISLTKQNIKLTEENTTISKLIDEHLNEYKSKMIEWEELIKRQSGIEPNKKPPNEGMN